jgi:glycosyltransferase involved in cell wall biosynthesis
VTRTGLTVSVVTNGNAEGLMATLRSALDTCQGMGAVDFLVVDNATTDETAGLLEALGGDVRSIRTETPLTPNAAWMLAKQASQGEYVLLLSNDVTLTEGWLEPVILSLVTDPMCIAASPAQVFNGQTFPSQPLTSATGVCLLVRESTDISSLNEAKYVPQSMVNYSAAQTASAF